MLSRLFILAHCLEFFGALAFLSQSVRRVLGEFTNQGRTLSPRRQLRVQIIDKQALVLPTTDTSLCRTGLDGFIYLVLAAQQALPAYYFLTAFAPSQNLVGEGLGGARSSCESRAELR